MDFFFSTVQLLVDIHQRENLLQTLYLTTLLKRIFYSNKAWIALHVVMAHFVWHIGWLASFGDCIYFLNTGKGKSGSHAGCLMGQFASFYLERFSSSAVSQWCWCFSLCNMLKSWGTPVCVWSSYLKCSTIKIMNVAMPSKHMLSTRLTASLNSILRMVPERNVAVKKNLFWNLLKKQQMMLWRLYHQNELLGEFSTQTTRIMWIKIAQNTLCAEGVRS